MFHAGTDRNLLFGQPHLLNPARVIEELARLQENLLVNVAPAVKPSGKLVYAVCTLARAETLAVAEAFERRASGFERLPLHKPLDPNAPASAQIEYWPHQFGDGSVFVAAWTRRNG